VKFLPRSFASRMFLNGKSFSLLFLDCLFDIILQYIAKFRVLVGTINAELLFSTRRKLWSSFELPCVWIESYDHNRAWSFYYVQNMLSIQKKHPYKAFVLIFSFKMYTGLLIICFDWMIYFFYNGKVYRLDCGLWVTRFMIFS
jgi:hypothetical protein